MLTDRERTQNGADRPFHPQGAEIMAQAYDAFDAWCRGVDPDGERDLFDLINEYGAPARAGGRP
jgi:hypothetical protein